MISMDVKILAGAIILVIIIAVGIVAFSGRHTVSTLQTSTTTYNAAGTGNQTANSSKTLFSSTQYYSYSYLIYPGPLSPEAQSALAGFNLTSTTLPNSTTKVTLTIEGTSQAQSIMLRPNYKLYVIETSFGDDSFHFDSSLGDDGFVVVDPNGYLAQ